MIVWRSLNLATTIVDPGPKRVRALEYRNEEEETITPAQSAGGVVVSSIAGVVEPVGFELTEP